MKTTQKLLFTLALIVLSAAGLRAQSNNSYIGQARGAVQSCLQPYLGSFYEITASVVETSTCGNGGSTHQVIFAAGPHCTGPGPCPLFPTVIVAVVNFDCEGNIVSATCGFAE
jgi:hypothetical protein